MWRANKYKNYESGQGECNKVLCQWHDCNNVLDYTGNICNFKEKYGNNVCVVISKDIL